MKIINQILSLAVIATLAFTSCDKADKLPLYGNGTAPVLSAASTTVAPPPADSNKYSLILNWTDPKHGQDPVKYKFVVEIDSSGRNFSKAVSRTLLGKLTDSIVAKDLNAMMLAWGFEFNKAYDLDVRVTSSYGNNNEKLASNILKIRATPYKIPPKVPLPLTGRLFIVGGATDGGWTNPVTVPAQEFARLDETTFGGVFFLKANDAYVLLPVNGSWDTKFVINDRLLPGVDTTGTFFFSTGPGQDFKTPATAGYYKMTIDFQKGTYKVAPITLQHGLPTNLFITGGATPGGWNNPVPLPSQQLTRRNAVQWDVTLNFTSGQAFLILPVNGSWGQKFGADVPAADNKSGTFKPEGGDFPAPATSGSYKFVIDFYSGKYQLTP